jgi:hypothetical protein
VSAVPVPPNPLELLLGYAAHTAQALDESVDVTRDAIVTMAAQLAVKIAELDRDQVAALGITVEVVTRTNGPLQEDVPGVTISHLPTIDSDEFERRPGATALYLDAFHGRADRVLLQIQSTPGVMVSATSTLERIESWLEPIRGIIVDAAGKARLVREIDVGGRIHYPLHADAEAVLFTFLQALGHELERRARFNPAAAAVPRLK